MARKKMDKELKTKWLRALRSGRYKQTQYHLIDNYDIEKSYCCLGVLCNISKEGKWEQGKFNFENTKNSNYIPKRLLPKFGITDETQKLLSRMNDNKNMSFKEIADWVEQNI